MGKARDIMDRITDAVMAGDRDALGRLYAPDAVAETPDAGRLEDRGAIVDYLMPSSRRSPTRAGSPSPSTRAVTRPSTRGISSEPTRGR